MKLKYLSFLVFAALFLCGCSVTKKASDDNLELKILSYNVRNARGMDDVTDYNRVANVIKRIDADCVALQELDSATERSERKVVLDELAIRTGMYSTFSASIDYQGGKYGVGILTKEKPLSHRSVPLPGSEEKRSLLLVEMKDYVICSTHWSLRQPDRLSSIAIINEAVKKYTDKPVFLAGDLNAEPESDEIRELSKEWLVLNDTNEPTIPVVNPNRCIDYVFVKKSDAHSFQVLQSVVENEPVASDHLPVWVKIKTSKK